MNRAGTWHAIRWNDRFAWVYGSRTSPVPTAPANVPERIRIKTGDVQVGVRQKNLPKKNELSQDVRSKQLQLREEALRKSIIKYRKSSKESADPHNPLRINP